VGKFDEWPESVYRMQRLDDGSWSLVLELEAGREYQYHYRTDKGAWHTDALSNHSNTDGVNHLVI
jgi:1,4-alpha-glucan branching enzyme